nr:phage Gp37/Gp68 family protein [Mesorhizobium sp.]
MTSIEWTHRPGTKGESWNPIRARNLKTGKVGWHCTHASDGCRNCYAERLNLNRRGLAFGTGLPYKPGYEQAAGSAEGATGAQRDSLEIFLDDKTLAQPLRWRQPRTIFVCSMTDLFGAFVSDALIDRVFAVAALCPQHTFIVLTKRSARMREYLTLSRSRLGSEVLGAYENIYSAMGALGREGLTEPHPYRLAYPNGMPWPLPNVWLGVSAERQQEADERIPDLLAAPAAIRFASLEPLLGPIDLTSICTGHYFIDALRGLKYHDAPEGVHGATESCAKLDWGIVGGESGPDARPMHPDWARSLRDQCAAAGTAFFFKQWGEFGPAFRLDLRPTGLPWSGEAQRAVHRGTATVEQATRRFGKRRAGRFLDGVEHNAWPSSPLEGEDGKARQAGGEPLAAPGEG